MPCCTSAAPTIPSVSGLVLAIESHIPQEQKDGFKSGYEDIYCIEDAAKKTGVEERLRAAGKKWFALSPKWIFDRMKAESQYDVCFWLNPYDQDCNNSMWCTVEDLDLWIKDEGPIPKRR
jgi:hypothetical protein